MSATSSRTELLNHAASFAEQYALRPPEAMARGPAGVYLGNDAGASIDFHDFREYQPGDDLRRVDWGAYARSDTLMIRLYREEVAPVVEVVADASASIGAYSGKEAALVFCAAFIGALTRHAEGRPALIADGARYPAGGFDAGLTKLTFTGEYALAFPQHIPPKTQNPVRFVLSDFLFKADMGTLLRSLARDTALFIPVCFLSESELRPRMAGGFRLSDVEDKKSSRDVRITGQVIDRYAERLEKHLAALEEAARNVRGRLVRIDVPDEAPSARDTGELVVTQLLKQGILETV